MYYHNCGVEGVVYTINGCFSIFVLYIELSTIQDDNSTTNYSPTQISESNDDQQKGITTHCH